MSAASRYGVARIERVVQPALLVAGLDNIAHEGVIVGDLITDLLHYADAHGFDTDVIMSVAERHYESERGEGDDLANDPTYDERRLALERQ